MKKFIPLFLSLCLLFCLTSCDESASSSTTKPTDQVQEIYTDELITMSFVKKKDEPSVPGAFYFYVKVENKSDSPITVYLTDAYVNDTMFTVMSGMPMSNIQPGKNATHGFFGKYDGTGISTVEEITKLGFKIKLEDESYKELKTTDYVEIKF